MTETTGLAAALGTLAFFGGIALLSWIDYLKKRKDRELSHQERLKALELGHPLPDIEIARSGTESTRAVMLGIIGLLVPISVIGMAVGATAIVFDQGEESIHLPLNATIWGVAGLVSLVTAINCAAGLISLRKAEPEEKESPKETEEKDHNEQIQEHLAGW